MVLRKPAKFENLELIFLKYPLWSITAKLENRESCEWNSIYQILILPPLNCYPALFPGKNIPNIAKSAHIFPGKGRGDKDFILTYLDSSMAEVFPHYCLIFPILAIFRTKREVNVGPKVLTLGESLFHKYSNLLKNFQTVFFSATVLPQVRISAMLDPVGE